MTDYEFIHQWTPDDVTRWAKQIRERDLSFEDQVAIVQFIKDQQQHYTNLHANYTTLWNAYQGARTKIRLLAPPVEALIHMARTQEQFTEVKLRAGLSFWTDQIVQDVLEG